MHFVNQSRFVQTKQFTSRRSYNLSTSASSQLVYWMHPQQQACRKASGFLRLSGDALPQLLGESDEKSFGASDVAQPIRVFVLNHLANKLRAARVEPGEGILDVVDGEHDA